MGQATQVNELFENLMGAVPEMDVDDRRLSIEIYRALAEGRPVGLARLAERTGLSVERIERILAGWPGVFRDEAGA